MESEGVESVHKILFHNEIFPWLLTIEGGIMTTRTYIGWLHSQHYGGINMAKEKIKAVCYCRVSTKSKEQEDSFENQKQFFEKYFAEHPEYELFKGTKNNHTGIYADRGVSGTLLHREEFENMLFDAGLDCGEYEYTPKYIEDADKNKYEIKYRAYKIERTGREPLFNEIIVKNTSRFARNISVSLVLQELRNLGVYVTFLDIGRSTRNEADISVIQLFQQFDEMFSRDLSRKLLAANQQSKENQILRTSGDLFGYKYIKRSSRAENNRLIKIDNEAYVIQLMFRLYYGCFKTELGEPKPMEPCDFKCSICPIKQQITEHDGLGFRLIGRLINETYGFRTRKGKEFTQTTLKHIFENEKFAGYLNTGKWDHGTVFNYKTYPQLRDEGKYLLVERTDLIDPIISMELFQLCTEKRNIKAGESKGKFKGMHTKYKGLIYCGMCGEVYTHNTASDKNRTGYYQCKTKRRKTKKYCGCSNVFDYQIENTVKDLCSGSVNEMIVVTDFQVLSTIYSLALKEIEFIKRNRNPEEIQALDAEIQTYTTGLKKLYTRMALENSDNNILENTISEMEETLKTLKEKYEKLTKKPKSIITEVQNRIDMCYHVIDSIKNIQPTYTEEELLSQVIDRFVIYGEPKQNEKGRYITPQASIVPVLKNETLLSSKLGIQIDLMADPIIENMGLENQNYIEEAKTKIDALQKEVENMKTLYL